MSRFSGIVIAVLLARGGAPERQLLRNGVVTMTMDVTYCRHVMTKRFPALPDISRGGEVASPGSQLVPYQVYDCVCARLC